MGNFKTSGVDFSKFKCYKHHNQAKMYKLKFRMPSIL